MRELIDIIVLYEGVSLPWGFGNAGCWVLPDGEILPCDYEADIHHGDIVVSMLDHDVDDPDELDEFTQVGISKGWLRIRMTRTDFCVQVDPKQITSKQLRMIPRIDEGNHIRYIYENPTGHQVFDSIGKLMLALRV